MNRRAVFIARLFLIASMASLLIIYIHHQPKLIKDGGDESATFLYFVNLTLINNGSNSMPLGNLTLIQIFTNNSWQHVVLKSLRYFMDNEELKGFSLYTDSEGNRVINLTGAPRTLPAKSSLKVYLKLHIRLEPRSLNLSKPLLIENSLNIEDIPEELKIKFSNPTSLWDFDEPWLKELISRLVINDTNVLNIVYSFLQWIDDNVRYPSIEEALEHIVWYPNQTYTTLRGDCDDRVNLFVTLCRRIGIPSYLEYGAIYYPGEESFASYFNSRYRHRMYSMARHGWTRCYIPPFGWLPIDHTYFKGARLVYVEGFIYIKASQPSDHILNSAILVAPTIVEGSVVMSDYMASNLKLAKLLEEYDAYIMVEEGLLKLLEG